MTVKVTITHDQPVCATDLLVTPLDAAGQLLGPAQYAPLLVRRVKPGETISMYVHAGCRLLVTEATPDELV